MHLEIVFMISLNCQPFFKCDVGFAVNDVVVVEICFEITELDLKIRYVLEIRLNLDERR